MTVTRISRSFKDISLSFDPHPVTKDLSVLTNERAIIRSVRNLVETIPTERFFNPTLGSNVLGLLGKLPSVTQNVFDAGRLTPQSSYLTQLTRPLTGL